MPSFFTALLLAAGAGTWIYTKLNRNTGGNAQNAAIGAGIISILIFFVAFMLLNLIT